MPNTGIDRVAQFGILLLLLTAQLTGLGQNDFEWKDASGSIHNLAELEEILRKHRQWVESGEKLGIQAQLTAVDLVRANLPGVNLSRADLSRAELAQAQLNGARLIDANLSSADLSAATLNGADLSRAHLMAADLTGANLTDAQLDGADLRGANVLGAGLTHAHLMAADLSDAELSFADLSRASLINVNLRRAHLRDTDLSGAHLFGASLGRAVFEPASLPELRGIAGAKNLELLTYDTNPDALVQLRKQFEDGGFREQERKITYALKRRETDLACEKCMSRKLPDEESARAIVSSSDSVLANCGSFVLNRLCFDWTCQYGMSPGRPLMLGLLLWFLCSLLYFGFAHTSGHAGLYRVYGHDVGKDESGQRRVERISFKHIAKSRGWRWRAQFFSRECMILRTSMFFSLMSAFNIGFRDINFGRWLRSLTRQDFDIKAVGWARVVAGWQSLISVYLLALWILTYFGRPFG